MSNVKDKPKLIIVLDVYGHKHRVAKADLESERIMLPLYNQYGRKLSETPGNLKRGVATCLHRDNIAPEYKPESAAVRADVDLHADEADADLHADEKEIAAWVHRVNALAARMDAIAASIHPSAWPEALGPDNQKFRQLAARGPRA